MNEKHAAQESRKWIGRWEAGKRPQDREEINRKRRKFVEEKSEGWRLHARISCQQGVAVDTGVIDHCLAGAGRYSNYTPVSHPQSHLPFSGSSLGHGQVPSLQS